MAHILKLDEGQRQLLLLACATLALERPGFQYALEDLTRDIDCVNSYRDGRSTMMHEFMRLNADRHGQAKSLEIIESLRSKSQRDIIGEL